jgi:hypothetical protein
MFGKQVVRIAQDFELAQRVPVEQFARQTQGPHRVIGGVAAGGVRQDGELRRRQDVEQVRLAGVLADVGAPNGDGDDLGAGGIDRRPRCGEILVLAGTDEQTGTIGLAGNRQAVGKMACVFRFRRQ